VPGTGQEDSASQGLQDCCAIEKRWIIEICEAIALLENYEDFERGRPGKKGLCVVHDSEGEHRIITELRS